MGVHLHSLYLQATSGDALEASPTSRQLERRASGSFAPVARAKLLGWRALCGLPAWTARCRLPFALAEVDPGFRAAHPHLAAANESQSMAAYALQTLERWPELDAWAASAQRCLFWLSGAVTAWLLASAWKARQHGVCRRVPPAAALCGVVTLYTGALVHGAPAWLHADMRLRLGLVKFASKPSAPSPDQCQDALQRMRRRAVSFFLPKVTCSLFSD